MKKVKTGKSSAYLEAHSLSDRMIRKLAYGMELGLTGTLTCQLAGVSNVSYINWRKQGVSDLDKGRDTMEAKLIQALEHAKAKLEEQCLTRIRLAATGGKKTRKTKKVYRTETVMEVSEVTGNDMPKLDDKGNVVIREILSEKTITDEVANPAWTADAWILERLRPERYAKNTNINVKDMNKEESIENIANHISKLVKKFGKKDA